MTTFSRDVNNHIHTTYSFSPYSPASAIYKALHAGLCVAGIMDHDSVAGAWEFIKAGEMVGIGTTVGVECRADFSRTRLAGKRINNPDQASIGYIALHGIPHTQLEKVTDFLKPYTAHRYIRNKKMVENMNVLFKPWSIYIDFEKDVIPISLYQKGGSITERHLCFALALKLIDFYGQGERLVNFLQNDMDINLKESHRKLLSDKENPHYSFDLLGLLKSELLPRFYIEAKEECPDVKDLIKFARSIAAISAYAYLGDVEESVTGDKSRQTYEDGYIELLFQEIKALGFNAVTFMPSRNIDKQLRRIMDLCDEFGLFQISGEDINSPRQSFICLTQRKDQYKHLFDSAWALVGHEAAATKDLSDGMFSTKTIEKIPDLDKRIQLFKEIGLGTINKDKNT